MALCLRVHRLDFNPPAPCGAGPFSAPKAAVHIISIHPPRAGRDQVNNDILSGVFDFNPPAPCGAGHVRLMANNSFSMISIHPPRAGRDFHELRQELCFFDFNPPAPCGAGLLPAGFHPSQHYFNPPAPCGAGLLIDSSTFRFKNFNPPAPCGAGRLTALIFFLIFFHFNPPAPCGAGLRGKVKSKTPSPFQSTRPVRGGTKSVAPALKSAVISIHPPRAGRDI